LAACKLVDHSVIDNLYHLKSEFSLAGGELEIIGLKALKTDK
jgi:hypothetical protein